MYTICMVQHIRIHSMAVWPIRERGKQLNHLSPTLSHAENGNGNEVINDPKHWEIRLTQRIPINKVLCSMQ